MYLRQPTRKLLALLAADSTDLILERLSRGPATRKDLIDNLGLDSRDVAGTLAQLQLVGLVRSRISRGRSRGRPRRIWELSSGRELQSLERYARAMHHRLTDGTD